METNNTTPAMGKGSSTLSADQASLSSFVHHANAQVEAAIAYLITDYQGMEIPEKALYGLAAQIKNIVSLTFTGSVDSTPATEQTLFVQVPNFIADNLTGDDFKELKDTIQKMESAVLNDPQFSVDHQDVDAITVSYLQIVDSAAHALKAREVGATSTRKPSLATEINRRIELLVSQFGRQLGNISRREVNELIVGLQDEVTAALGGKPRLPLQSQNPNSKALIQLYLPLSLSRNSEYTLSEVELIQMALRKLQYDYTRKLTHYTKEGIDDYAAGVAFDLTTADKVMAKLFEAMSTTVELLNDSIFGLLPHGRDLAYSGHEDNIRTTYREHYQEYSDDTERPGV